MHPLLARTYHMAQHGLHVATWPVVQGLFLAAAIAALGRLAAPGRSRLVAALSLLGGWGAATWPLWQAFHAPPVARLPGAAIALACFAIAAPARVYSAAVRRGATKGRKAAIHAPSVAASPKWALPALCVALAWWLRGAPLGGNAILNGMALFLCLLATWAIANRMTKGDEGWAVVAAVLTLSGSLFISGASPHWATVALIPVAPALLLLGLPEAGAVMVGSVVIVAAAAIVASNRGRFVPVDAACLLPLLALLLARRIAPRRRMVGALAAALISIGLCWLIKSGLNGFH